MSEFQVGLRSRWDPAGRAQVKVGSGRAQVKVSGIRPGSCQVEWV